MHAAANMLWHRNYRVVVGAGKLELQTSRCALNRGWSMEYQLGWQYEMTNYLAHRKYRTTFRLAGKHARESARCNGTLLCLWHQNSL